eukprot:TRINITY_DN14174_c0_g1_i1.p2 TRINITY_DN14174_c0_g1~~TRINITY_DN14174_c0_g1_i1.p2  ORF type:complete len:274 (+),score=78.56 TRINITY_DN14174_c0_g1_i1:99-920(+)
MELESSTSDRIEDEENPDEKKFGKGKCGPHAFRKRKYGRRNTFFLRVGKNTVLPLTVLLGNQENFSDILLQELLSILRELVPLHFGKFQADTPDIDADVHFYRGEHLQFIYQFRPVAAKYCVIAKTAAGPAAAAPARHTPPPAKPELATIKVEEDVAHASRHSEVIEEGTALRAAADASRPQAPPQDDDDEVPVYQGGQYAGFTIMRWSLLVETTADSDPDAIDALNAKHGVLNQFFAPAPAKRRKGDDGDSPKPGNKHDKVSPPTLAKRTST